MKILYLLLCLGGIAYGQRPQGTVEADAVSFIRGADSVTLELYYSIQQGALTFVGDGNKWSAEIPVIAEVWQDDKQIAVRTTNKHMTFEGSKDDLAAKSTNLILDVIKFDIPARKNTVTHLIFHGKDRDGKEIFDTLRRLTYVPFAKSDSFVFSGVTLAASLQPATSSEHPFYKVGYVILPNPSLIFGGEYSALNYYTELNTPKSYSSTGDSVSMEIRLLDGSQTEVLKRNQMVAVSAPITPFLGSLDIEGLSTDSYSIVISATFRGKLVAVIRKGFFLESGMIISEESEDTNPVATDEETIYQTSDISNYSDLELSEKIAQSEYVMPNDTRKAINKVQASGEKKRMLFKYWRSQDEPGTRPLSAFRQFNARVERANQLYTYQKTIGWKTHRGRIYITYGPPEYVGGEPFATDSKPYIVWQYYERRFPLSSGSRAEFVFVDIYGGGNFQLVHSNVRGEVSQPDWYRNEAFRLR